MHEVLVNRLGGLSLPRKSVVRLTDRPDMTLDVYRGRKTTQIKCENEAQQYTENQGGMSKRPAVMFVDYYYKVETPTLDKFKPQK